MANTGHAARVDARVKMGSGRQFVLAVSKWVELAKENRNAVMRGVAMKLTERIIKRTPVDTGRARANWMVSTAGIDSTTVDVPSAYRERIKDEGLNEARRESARAYSTQQSMARADGILKWDPETHPSIYITNSLPYMLRLEYGWSVKQAPGGMVRLTMLEAAKVIGEQLRIVRARKANLP